MSRGFDGANDLSTWGSNTSVDDVFAGGGTLLCSVFQATTGESTARTLSKSNLGFTPGGWASGVAGTSATSSRIFFSHSFEGIGGQEGDWTTDTVAGIVPLNKWAHIAITYDNSSILNDPLIYVDGVSQTVTENVTPIGTAASDAAQTGRLGNVATGTRTFSGNLANVALFDRILAAEEIQQWIQLPGSITRGCVMFSPQWNSPVREGDYSGNNNNVVIGATNSGAAVSMNFPPTQGTFVASHPLLSGAC